MSQGPERNKRARERSPRKRLTKEQRRLIWEYLDIKFGEPRHCFEGGCRGKPTLDHLDGDPNNNHLENFRPACPQHQKRPRTVVNKRVSVRIDPSSDVGPSDNLVIVRERYQAALTEWLTNRIGPDGPHQYLPANFVEQEASYDLHISSVTIHRYIVHPGEMVASNAPFRLIDRVLPGDRPSRPTKCIMWRGNKLDQKNDDEASETHA